MFTKKWRNAKKARSWFSFYSAEVVGKDGRVAYPLATVMYAQGKALYNASVRSQSCGAATPNVNTGIVFMDGEPAIRIPEPVTQDSDSGTPGYSSTGRGGSYRKLTHEYSMSTAFGGNSKTELYPPTYNAGTETDALVGFVSGIHNTFLSHAASSTSGGGSPLREIRTVTVRMVEPLFRGKSLYAPNLFATISILFYIRWVSVY